MDFYIIYDNLYEEFQQPFCIKNDTVAKEEFLTFKKGLIDQANTNEEKNKINTRYYLYKFNGLKFDKKDDIATITTAPDKYVIEAEAIEWGNEGDESNE